MAKSVLIVILALLGLGVIVLGFVAYQSSNQSVQETAHAATAEADAASAHATADTAMADAAAAHATVDIALADATLAHARVDAAETTSAVNAKTAQSVSASASATADANQANASQTKQAAQFLATSAAVRETEQAQILSCDKPIDLGLIPENRAYFTLIPGGAESAIPLDERGTKPLSIKLGDAILFHYHPSTDVEIYYVKCLFFQVYFLNSADTPPGFDFSLWNPSDSGWGINGGKNKLGWGENLVEIASPNDVVSRQGDIYLSLRDYGTSKATVLKMGFTLVLLNRDGSERTIHTTIDTAQ